MTTIVGNLTDVSGTPVDGVLFARAVDYRANGSRTVSTDGVEFAITGGVLSAPVAPGLVQLTLIIGPVQQTWLCDIPDAPSVGIGDLLGDL